jgi:hypothetical protein
MAARSPRNPGGAYRGGLPRSVAYTHPWPRPPRTFGGYESLLRINAIPSLGLIPLTDLGPLRLQRLYADLLLPGRGLSAGSVLNLHLALHQRLRPGGAGGDSSLATPPRGRQPPRPERSEHVAVDTALAGRLVETSSGTRFENLSQSCIDVMREARVSPLSPRSPSIKAVLSRSSGPEPALFRQADRSRLVRSRLPDVGLTLPTVPREPSELRSRGRGPAAKSPRAGRTLSTPAWSGR